MMYETTEECMKYLYLLAAVIMLITAAPTRAQAAPTNPPNAPSVLALRSDLPGDMAIASGHGNRSRNDRNRGDRNRNGNRDDRRGWQRNNDHRRAENRSGFRWVPPWRWFLNLHLFQRGHRGH
jgi:hypothetical protein